MYPLKEEKHAHMDSYPQHEHVQQQPDAQFGMSLMRPPYPNPSYQPQPTVFQPQQQQHPQLQQTRASEPGYNLPLQQHIFSYSDEDGIGK